MTMNIREALLDHTENRNFHVVGQPAKRFRDMQLNFDLAAFRESVHVPAKRGRKTSGIKKRRMQQMRNGANFPADLLAHCSILGDSSGSRRIEIVGLSLYDCNVHAKSGEQLPDAVV